MGIMKVKILENARKIPGIESPDPENHLAEGISSKKPKLRKLEVETLRISFLKNQFTRKKTSHFWIHKIKSRLFPPWILRGKINGGFILPPPLRMGYGNLAQNATVFEGWIVNDVSYR